MLTLRIYNLRTENQEEKFADLYDYLYKDEYQQLAIQNDLIEYQNSIQSKIELENELDRLLVFYEGMTMRVDWNGILIYGDILDDNTYDYIIDELTIKCFGF
jgi:hypothetical protein